MTEQTGGRIVADGVVEQASWIGSEGRPLLGWFAFPTSERVRGAVVLCPPLGSEATSAYRTFRTLSRELARRGLLALRFDYDGTGDSAGDFDDPGVVERWTGSIGAAVGVARAWGAPSVSVVGMRLGATLAYAAACTQDLDLDRLVLWDPCPSGRHFLREHQAVMGHILNGREVSPAGWAELPWYRLSPDNADALRRLKVEAAPGDHAPARHLIVLLRTDRSSSALRGALASADAEWLEARGQDLLLDVDSPHARVPRETVAELVERLDDSAPTESGPLTPRAATVTSLRLGTSELRESVEFFGERGLIFGVRTTPAPGDARKAARVVLVNPANHPHLGPGRMWVALSRALAGAGFECVRMSVTGAGNSGTFAGQEEDRVFAPGSPADVRQLVGSLVSESAASVSERIETVGIGLSSSALLSLEETARGTFDHAVAINPGLVLPRELVPSDWLIPRRMPSWWSRLAPHFRAHRLVMQLRASVLPFTHPLWGVHRIRKGTGATLVITDWNDARLVHQPFLWRLMWGRRLERSGRLRVIVVPEGDHALMVSSDQEHVTELVVERLSGLVGPRVRSTDSERRSELVDAR